MAFASYGDGNVGASQFGGGGFMASPAPGHENQYGGAQQKSRSQQHNSLRAFTIRHLLKEIANADDEHYMADGHDISMVTIVGKVTTYQEGPTRDVLYVYDGTAGIEICSWVDDAESQAQKRIDLQVGRWVRVYGTLKTFERKRSITAFSIKPITDHNEVTYHFLQAIMQHLHLTKGAPPTGAQQPQQQPGSGVGGTMQQMGNRTPGGGSSYGGVSYGGAPAAGGDIAMDLNRVFNQPHALQSPNGLSIEQALSELRNMGRNYTLQQVKLACESLAADGLLYTTINETTFKSCA